MPFMLTAICCLSVFAMQLVCLLPWSGDEAARLGLLLLPVVAMLYWDKERPEAMTLLLPFASGLLSDAVMQGPLGLWSAVSLIAVGAGRLLPESSPGSLMRAWMRLTALASVAALAMWLLASLYHLAWQAPQPFARAVLFVGAAAPVVMLVLMPLVRLGAERPRLRLDRQG